MARGAAVETKLPKVALSNWSRLTMPRPIVTGSMSANTWRRRGSRQSTVKARRKSMRRSAEATMSICTAVAASQATA